VTHGANIKSKFILEILSRTDVIDFETEISRTIPPKFGSNWLYGFRGVD
jgi:hypothetical protein